MESILGRATCPALGRKDSGMKRVCARVLGASASLTFVFALGGGVGAAAAGGYSSSCHYGFPRNNVQIVNQDQPLFAQTWAFGGMGGVGGSGTGGAGGDASGGDAGGGDAGTAAGGESSGGTVNGGFGVANGGKAGNGGVGGKGGNGYGGPGGRGGNAYAYAYAGAPQVAILSQSVVSNGRC
jgi:hypothetical protein